jgi:ABC-2 type transport system permease protein
MSHIWRVAWTIARRDYVAAVFSRLFLIFVLLPLIFAGIGGVFGAIGAQNSEAPRRTTIGVTDPALYGAVAAAHARLVDRLGEDALPALLHVGSDARDDAATLSGTLDHPRLAIARHAPDGIDGEASLLIEDARAAHALGAAARPTLTIVRPPPSAGAAADDGMRARITLAKAAQYGVLLLTIMLAGRLLSSFIEERSNKVIEVLAAAAPVDAIFLGKLLGMLLFSFTCILAWGAIAGAGALLLAPGAIDALPAPAVGWPLFAPLALIYFASSFLLLGAVMLGLGAHANSPSDIQTLALPTTIGQLLLFGFASVGVARPESLVAKAAAIFPWSSPLAMLARAAELPTLWPHLPAMLWQFAWLALTIRLVARRFRSAVLKSGGVGRVRRG